VATTPMVKKRAPLLSSSTKTRIHSVHPLSLSGHGQWHRQTGEEREGRNCNKYLRAAGERAREEEEGRKREGNTCTMHAALTTACERARRRVEITAGGQTSGRKRGAEGRGRRWEGGGEGMALYLFTTCLPCIPSIHHCYTATPQPCPRCACSLCIHPSGCLLPPPTHSRVAGQTSW